MPAVLRQAEDAGAIKREILEDDSADPAARRKQREQLSDYMREQGYRPQPELIAQLMTQKLLRAVYSERQLEAVLVDFWYNHFNVAMTDPRIRTYLLSYERDAILPGVLGNFVDMLVETATHPAMLLYLNNAQSTADETARTTLDASMERRRPLSFRGGRTGEGRYGESRFSGGAMRAGSRRGQTGLNENYARELLELHTLGVDGGYTQEDVIEVARAFSGWSVMPMGPEGDKPRERFAQMQRQGIDLGFLLDGNFLFRADAHDAGRKTVLGRQLPAGRAMEDGIEILQMLAAHPETARHLARKIAVRFVSDEPPQSLIDRLTKTFLASRGSTASVVRTLAYSAEFWSQDSLRQKIKSPFELAVSSIRALDAEITDPYFTVRWVERMGQPLYAYQAPTGYPDRAEAWVNTGSLLGRMNFGLSLASGRIPGVEFDLAALNGYLEPASVEEALETHLKLLLPERATEESMGLLRSIVNDPAFGDRLDQAATLEDRSAGEGPGRMSSDGFGMSAYGPRGRRDEDRFRRYQLEMAAATPPTTLAKVVGVILGSPEFQRR